MFINRDSLEQFRTIITWIAWHLQQISVITKHVLDKKYLVTLCFKQKLIYFKIIQMTLAFTIQYLQKAILY